MPFEVDLSHFLVTFWPKRSKLPKTLFKSQAPGYGKLWLLKFANVGLFDVV